MKLYWRIKKDGKWTWMPATKTVQNFVNKKILEEEE